MNFSKQSIIAIQRAAVENGRRVISFQETLNIKSEKLSIHFSFAFPNFVQELSKKLFLFEKKKGTKTKIEGNVQSIIS